MYREHIPIRSPKRRRMSGGDPYVVPPAVQHGYVEENPPSKVLQVKGFRPSCIEAELITAFQRFGQIIDVVMIPSKAQGLIEFSTIDEAVACVQEQQLHNVIRVGDTPVTVAFSASQSIRGPPVPKPYDDPSPNHILDIIVNKAVYAITTQVMHMICSKFGRVLRIVIGNKRDNTVPALVEFESVAVACKALEELDGADIYADCCTLSVNFAKMQRLNVRRNDDQTFDYTNDMPGGEFGPAQSSRKPPSLLHPAGNYNNGPPARQIRPEFGGQRNFGSKMDVRGPRPFHAAGPVDGSVGHDRVAVMVYGLNPDIFDCDKLFNLLCLFGDVNKIKFLYSKPGTAMAEVAGMSAAQQLINKCRQLPAFGSVIEIKLSHTPHVVDVPPDRVERMKNGSPSFKNYIGNRYNRFATPELASKNVEQIPAESVYFFNCPSICGEDQMIAALKAVDAPMPSNISFFRNKDARHNKIGGILKFTSIEDAVATIVLANHCLIEVQDIKSCLKLCFAQASHR